MKPFRSFRSAITVAAAGLALCSAGCHHRRTATGSMAGLGQTRSVDNSWINAARSCWPDLAKNGYNNGDIGRNLIRHLGDAFPAYSVLSRNGGDADLSMPITTVLPPDGTKLEDSQTPVLTRGQAVAGVGPQGAVVANTHGNAPPDALCSIQPGIPNSFSK